MAGWWEGGEYIEDLTDWNDDDPRWDDDPPRVERDEAADGDLYRKAIREGSA